MNRQIKFRGLRTDGKGWVYGFLYWSEEIAYILPFESVAPYQCVQIIPETVGQFTDLIDKNGTEIYEGDKDDNGRVMLWNKGMCLFAWHHWNDFSKEYCISSYPTYSREKDRITVSGNIHQESEVNNG